MTPVFGDGVIPPLGGFTAFPEVLCRLTNLEYIHMTHQRLVQLPSSLSDLQKLAGLHL